MKYLLRKAVIHNVPEIDISEQDYKKYIDARDILLNAFAIEEKYEILITNFLDFEKQILTITNENIVREFIDYSDSFEIRLSLNVRLVNFLTAAKLYIDQINQNVKFCVPNDTNSKERIKKLFSGEYDRNIDYRFMEELRNYVQHRGLPVHQTGLDWKWKSIDDKEFLEHSLKVFSQKSYLEDDGKFKKNVLAEYNEKIELKATTRRYVESISCVHANVREVIEQSVKSGRQSIEEAHSRYRTVFNGNLIGLSACKWHNGKETSTTPLLLDWDDIRIKLLQRNGKLTNLSKFCITSRA